MFLWLREGRYLYVLFIAWRGDQPETASLAWPRWLCLWKSWSVWSDRLYDFAPPV